MGDPNLKPSPMLRRSRICETATAAPCRIPVTKPARRILRGDFISARSKASGREGKDDATQAMNQKTEGPR